MKTVKVYVGCGLTHAPEEFRAKVEDFKEKLRSIPGVVVLSFLGLKEGTNHSVYVHDIHNCVYQCDLLVAICDEPSIGLGYEMATQIEARKKPCIALGHADNKITRLILDPKQPGYDFYRYQDLCNDAFNIVKTKIEKVRATKPVPSRGIAIKINAVRKHSPTCV